jgi:hypothetical protein
MRVAGRRYRVDWAHLGFVLFLAAVMVAYLLDARGVSLKTNNLLMLQPAVMIGLVLCLIVLPQCFHPVDDDRRPAPDRTPTDYGELLRVGLLAGAFLAFVLSMERVGFDVAAWAFVTFGLWLCGERKVLALTLFPLVFTAIVVAAFRWILPYPFPTVIL